MSSDDVCADCSAPVPTWASINRGVLICDECCSVHRSLGRHISCVRSLGAKNWPPVLRDMVYTLVKKGANAVWEHALHDPHSKVKIRKPSPKDKLQPTKHDFIVMKYKHLMLLSKANSKDNPNLVQELSKQLHASVRTANLDTCLRILSLGADPNFLHPERGNTPLHVAAQAGQAMQVELLVVYGANPTTLDRLGHTSEECARIAGHHDLADRLIECQYELTDKLSYFLCGRNPSHSTGEHYLLPAGSTSNSIGLTEARTRLQELNNQLLEELAADMYEEVDRRESDAIWLTTQQISSSVAFLPVNPKLSHLRNQGRQKLGTLDTQEFSQLLIDILIDSKRRQTSSVSTGAVSGTAVPSTSEEQDDQHDYDEVPVENERDSVKRKYPAVQEEQVGSDDYAVPQGDGPSSVPPTKASQETRMTPLPAEVPPQDPTLRPLPSLPSQDITTPPDVNMLLERLKKVEAERDALASANQLLEQKLSEMQKRLNRMIEENAHLPPVHTPTQKCPPVPIPSPEAPSTSVYSIPEKPKSTCFEPKTVCSPVRGSDKGRGMPSVSSEGDTSDAPCDGSVEEMVKKQLSESTEEGKTLNMFEDANCKASSHSPDGGTTKASSHSPDGGTTKASSHSPDGGTTKASSHSPDGGTTKASSHSPDGGTTKASSHSPDGGTQEHHTVGDVVMPPKEATDLDVITPSSEEVDGYIKLITQNIQELIVAAQGHKQASFGPSSAKVAKSIAEMTKCCFSMRCSQSIQASLREVGLASQQLQRVCQDSTQTDLSFQTQLIRSCCFDVAKAARHLVMCVKQEQ